MTEPQAKAKLQEVLNDFTVGRILGLLGEIYHSDMEAASSNNDVASAMEFSAVGDTLTIVGTGIDARYPV